MTLRRLGGPWQIGSGCQGSRVPGAVPGSGVRFRVQGSGFRSMSCAVGCSAAAVLPCRREQRTRNRSDKVEFEKAA